MLSASQIQARCNYKYIHMPLGKQHGSCLQTQVSTTCLHFCSGRYKGLHRPNLHCLLSAPFWDANSGGWGAACSVCPTTMMPTECASPKPALVYTNLSD